MLILGSWRSLAASDGCRLDASYLIKVHIFCFDSTDLHMMDAILVKLLMIAGKLKLA